MWLHTFRLCLYGMLVQITVSISAWCVFLKVLVRSVQSFVFLHFSHKSVESKQFFVYLFFFCLPLIKKLMTNDNNSLTWSRVLPCEGRNSVLCWTIVWLISRESLFMWLCKLLNQDEKNKFYIGSHRAIFKKFIS